MKILLPTSISLDEAQLPLEDGDLTVSYDPQSPIPEEHIDAEVLVAWVNTDEQLADAARRMTNLRMIQALAAGPDQVAKAGFSEDVIVCSGIGLHDVTVAEHTLALTLALVRSLPTLGELQKEHVWSKELGGAQELHPAGRVTTLLDARVTIWGFGSIGTTVAGLFEALGAQVTGIARNGGERHGYRVVATEEKDEVLANTDVLVMILPNSEATHHALDAEALATLPDSAYVVNVGRGPTVDEPALIAALEEGKIAGAGIDVTTTEPLPADNPLWDAPNLIITPHSAGGRPVGGEKLIGHNLEALRGRGEYRNAMNA
ncbi:phosphoglycerate dehydrogenase [uncultured Kocuria sp.]|uniref:phosphoglycerate dehydrogenase n=1 Tax=Kocuria sp. HSID16901 TaxID=2419505 RepID=UPI000660E99A|nr:phosphoglycerate dehydrogenase [Kocuria sp. HSID16901]MCT1367077.1 phosphoglycerate dehydrogenase [Rothia sp. p3-SID1597]RUQ21780.1 phosphoglycerate dehydrogenase [Kocuria sp. HSID16901]